MAEAFPPSGQIPDRVHTIHATLPGLQTSEASTHTTLPLWDAESWWRGEKLKCNLVVEATGRLKRSSYWKTFIHTHIQRMKYCFYMVIISDTELKFVLLSHIIEVVGLTPGHFRTLVCKVWMFSKVGVIGVRLVVCLYVTLRWTGDWSMVSLLGETLLNSGTNSYRRWMSEWTIFYSSLGSFVLL